MTLENRMLQKLADQASTAGRQPLQIQDAESGWTVDMTTDRRDDLSCLIWEMTLTRTQSPPANLGHWAREVADRTLALTEPLKLQEVDSGREEAVLRTVPVQRRGQTLYYEARLRGSGALTLRRYQVAAHRREQTAFPMTNETVARLIGEITGA